MHTHGRARAEGGFSLVELPVVVTIKSYDFTADPGAGPSLNYTATATPVVEPATRRHFFVNQTGIIRASVGAAATSASQPLD